MRVLLLSVLLTACACAQAAGPAPSYVKKYDVPLPDAHPAQEIEVDMPAPVVIAPAVPATKAAAVSASGMPMVPASDPANPAPAAAVAAPVPAANLVPGKPVVAYATLAQAAKAGVDPLGEHKPAVRTAPAISASSGAFDIKQPGTWLSWLQAHRDIAAKYGLTALAILLAALGVARFLARRGAQG